VKKTEFFGVFHNLPFKEYQQKSGLNQSTLKQFLLDDYKQQKNYKNFQVLQFGNAGHCLLLEPEKFKEIYVRAPSGLSRRKKIGKKRWLEFCKLHREKIVLTNSDWIRLQNIRKFFQIHPQIQNIFSNGDSEVSLFWQDSEYGFNCKSRLDWFDEESGKIVDLKFTNNISKAKSIKTIQNIYSLQAAWYTRGVFQLTKKKTDFFYVFIENFAPHFIQIVPVSTEDLKKGQQQVDYLIKNITQIKNL